MHMSIMLPLLVVVSRTIYFRDMVPPGTSSDNTLDEMETKPINGSFAVCNLVEVCNQFNGTKHQTQWWSPTYPLWLSARPGTPNYINTTPTYPVKLYDALEAAPATALLCGRIPPQLQSILTLAAKHGIAQAIASRESMEDLEWARRFNIHSILIMLITCVMLCAELLLKAGGLLLAIDAVKAVVGFAIRVAQLGPQQSHIHVISRLMKTACKIIALIFPLKPYNSNSIKPLLNIMTFALILSWIPGLLAAGTETPKVTMQDYFLPGVTKWNGIPYHDFRRIWWIALCAALGNVSQEGWSLLQTARNEDLGSTGNPGTANQAIQSTNRNQRLFGAILNYIEATSYIYRYASASFNNDGRGLFNYIYHEGHLPYTSEQRTTLENEWTDATMSKVGIKFTSDAVFAWAEYIDNLAGKLNKSEQDKRVKYLAGFPASFDVMIVPERSRGALGSYVHPANYPAHHPNAGDPHPHAGEPDIQATAHAFYSEWARMIDKGMIKSVPKGMVYQAKSEFPPHSNPRPHPSHRPVSRNHHGYRSSYSDDSNSDEESANMARSSVNSRTVCGVCGGIGHAGKVDGVGSCLTSRLGHRIPNSDLSRVTYPDGYNPPRFMYKQKANASSRDRSRARAAEREYSPDEIASDDDAAAKQVRFKNSRNKYKNNRNTSRRPTPKRARHVDNDSLDLEPPSPETPQNSTPDADFSESDNDEQSRLAIAFESIEFP